MVIFITVYTKFVDEFRNLLFSYSLLEPLYHPNVTKKNADKNEHGHGMNWRIIIIKDHKLKHDQEI